MTALNRRLKSLYGARLGTSVNRHGGYQIVSLYCECLGNEFAFGGEKVLESCADILKSVIFDPAFEDGIFKANDVEIEKKNLCDQIQSVLNDKRQYALLKLREKMCENEPYGIFELGSIADAEKITPHSLFSAWKSILETARVEIILIGSGNAERIDSVFANAFGNVARENIVKNIAAEKVKPEKVKTVVEHLPINQAKLVMGLRAGISSPENMDAIHLATTILGGSPHSKLFANVREKMSLCYYCLSYIEKQSGIIYVDSGIDEKNYEKARGEILCQLDQLKMGNFTDDEMNFGKLYLKNSFTLVEDSLDSIYAYYIAASLSGNMRSPREVGDAILKITRDEVVEAASRVCLDTVYLLAGMENN